MHDVVFHHHFEYRVVKARANSTRVWHCLTVHRTLARNVRHLEIADRESSEIIPTSITATGGDGGNTQDESNLSAKQKQLLVSAIAEMHDLQSLKWSHTDSLILIGSLWLALPNCPNLFHVGLNDNTLFSPPKDQDPEEEGGNSHVDKDTAVRSYLQSSRFPRLTKKL